jgi:hypothetical protein
MKAFGIKTLFGLLLLGAMGPVACDLDDAERVACADFDPNFMAGTDALCETYGGAYECTLSPGYNLFGECAALCEGDEGTLFSTQPLAWSRGDFTTDGTTAWTCIAKP